MRFHPKRPSGVHALVFSALCIVAIPIFVVACIHARHEHTALAAVLLLLLVMLGLAATGALLIVDRDRARDARLRSESEYRLLFQTIPHPMLVYDEDTSRILAANDQAIRHYGYSHDEFLSMRVEDLVVGKETPGHASGDAPPASNLAVQTHRQKDRQTIVVEISIFPMHFRGEKAVLMLINDITEHRRHSEDLEYRVKYDTVTGRLNRMSFSTWLDNAIVEAQQRKSTFYTLILGLNEFKKINTSLGYAIGDQLLQKASERLMAALGENASAARLGGDEFAFLVDLGLVDCRTLAEAVLEKMRQPFAIDDTPIQLSASIGIAHYPRDGSSTNQLLQHANSALLEARQGDCGYAFYDDTNDHLAPERVLLATQLLRGLDEHKFELHYQPKIPLLGANQFGFEALARWNSPSHGLASPGDFISVIESGDLIHPFTLWVLNTAVEQCKQWHALGYPVTMAINVSARNLLDPLLPERIRQTLARHKLDPKYLELEITESSIMSNPERSLDVLLKIRATGVKVAIDDFGTGYSSLAYLRRLPVDSLKIDRSFIAELDRDHDTRPIINFIIAMAHGLGIVVTAEGIENRLALTKLAKMRCDYAQGYYISKPMSTEDVLAWLRQYVPKVESEPDAHH